MPLPPSFARDGFVPAEQVRKHRRVLIGTDGPSNSGKTEFAVSAPGPIIVLCLDRGHEAMLDNANPPSWRQPNVAWKVIPVPLATQATQNQYLEYWKAFYSDYLKALANLDVRTVVLDGDSDSWELQRLAEFGKLTQIPSIMYAQVNAARRAMIARAYDSGKTIIATNKITKSYEPKLDKDGNPEMRDGKIVREWDGKSYERQGFNDQDYLWQIQLRHLYRDDKGPEWGVKIMKCKTDPALQGQELWGEDCNMPTLLQAVYPKVALKEWGY